MEIREVTEDFVKRVAELAGPDSDFYTALRWADDYRQAGMTPVFYTDEEERKLFVTTEEKMNGTKFH
jgi:hypothetical protein